MSDVLIAILAVLAGLAVGAIGGYVSRTVVSQRRSRHARGEAAGIVERAREQQRESLIEAKEEALRVRSAGEAELKERRSEFQRMERRMANREENLERRGSNLERKERGVAEKERAADALQRRREELKAEAVARLEEISGMSHSDAKALLTRQAEEDIQEDLAARHRDLEQRAKEEADDKARHILSQSIQRLASDVVSEATLTTVPLPSDDMKGRLIGREGRNIRAIEKATGVDLIIDDTPEAVTLSCFDPIRREVARVAVGRLIKDGRIHPARVEDTVAKTEKEVWETIRKSGEEAAYEAGVRGLNAELVKLLGRLKYRYSYGENVLQHSLEVSHLAGLMAGEIGADVKVAKAGGLLHDIGKALTHEVEGPHAEIGAEVAAKHRVPPAICAAIGEHHDDHMSSAEAFLVSAADALSAARPGARRDTVENYIQRIQALEEVALDFDGVEKCFAIQAGREVRVMVQPDDVDDVAASKMARDIVRKIEDTLVYPGQIKVIVIRESRSVEYAR